MISFENETNEDNEVQKIANAVIEWAKTYFGFRKGASDRAVLVAHALKARETGSLTYSIGLRELGKKAGCSHVAATMATRRLIARRFLDSYTSVGNSLTPRIYRLCVHERKPWGFSNYYGGG